jgi:GNAT superfamily N-acetyltransferase
MSLARCVRAKRPSFRGATWATHSTTKLQIHGVIQHPNGHQSGDFATQLLRTPAGPEARIQVIELFESYRRIGFTQAFVEALEDFYRSIGVTAVDLLASNYTGSVVGGNFVFAIRL